MEVGDVGPKYLWEIPLVSFGKKAMKSFGLSYNDGQDNEIENLGILT